MNTPRRSSSKSRIARTPATRKIAQRQFSLPELLEARTMLSAYTVNSTLDDGSVEHTLRYAVAQVNAGFFDEIDFQFASAGTITLDSSLTVTQPVLINGTKDASKNALVTLDGGFTTDSALVINAAGVTVKNLAITNFSDAGIVLKQGGGDTLEGNYVGLDYTGTVANGNLTGVSILSDNNRVVGNIISGNYIGVEVAGTGNTLQGNYIGTDVTGTIALGNGNMGVLVDSANNTLIGGATSDLRNIISGNNREGVVFTNDVTGPNSLEDNYIGVDVTGLQPLGNGAAGINVGTFDRLPVSNLVIANNVISANNGNGIYLWTSTSATVQGNWIGTDGTGHAGPYDVDNGYLFQNFGDGILLAARSTGNLIGGAGAAQNIISGNSGSSITSNSGLGTINTVQGNLLGLDIDHAADGNSGNGITVHTGELDVTGNTMAANLGDGIVLDKDGGFGVLKGNFIGTDSLHARGLGNASDGVLIYGSNNVIGGPNPCDGNVIAYNATAGVDVYSGQNNTIRGNSIFSNALLGIGLGSEGVVLPNNSPPANPMDPTLLAPNLSQNYPLISSVSGTTSDVMTVTGTMHGTPGKTYVLDFYTNTDKDGSEFGEGETYIGSITTDPADVNGDVPFSHAFPNVLAGQKYWSATATDDVGNTSEFSMDVTSAITAPQKASTGTILSSSLNPSVFGQSVTLTSTVTPNGGTAPLMGTISFIVNNTVIKVVTLDGTSNSATWVVSFMGGDTPVTAVYSGDANYTGSQNMLTQTVGRAGSLTSVVSSLNPSTYGQSVKFTATVLGQAGNGVVPTGSVTFMDNGNPIGTVGLDSTGQASLSTAGLTVGSHSITAMYNPDSNYAGSVGGLTQTVNAAAGTISGHTYFDVTGNGLTVDDRLMGGITVKLFQDKNGNGTLDAGDGAAIKTFVSDNSGAYTFGGILPGKYFVQEVTPSGYVRTAPANSTYYTDVMTSGLVIASNDFDNYQTGCCCNSLTGVKYVINGKYTYTDLRGHVHQGDTVQVQFTVLSGHTDLLSLVSYTAPGSSFNANTASQQQISQVATGTFGPGYHTLTVVVPRCYFQIDFVCGAVIDHFGPAGSNIFYSAQDRLISADNGGYVPPPAH